MKNVTWKHSCLGLAAAIVGLIGFVTLASGDLVEAANGATIDADMRRCVNATPAGAPPIKVAECVVGLIADRHVSALVPMRDVAMSCFLSTDQAALAFYRCAERMLNGEAAEPEMSGWGQFWADRPAGALHTLISTSAGIVVLGLIVLALRLLKRTRKRP